MFLKWRYIKRLFRLVVIIVFVKLLILIIPNLSETLLTDTAKQDYDKYIAECLEEDNGTGCNLPYLDPFHKDHIREYTSVVPLPIVCGEPDWVKCRFSKCNLQPRIAEIMEQIQCIYQDIIHISDKIYKLGPPVAVNGDQEYILRKSDYVRIHCSARRKTDYRYFWKIKAWVGYGYGIRLMEQKLPPPGRENGINVVVVALDSISKNGFIRMLPKSYEFITKELKATVLNKYNIVADGTKEAIIPILSGKRYFELKESRKSFSTEPFDPTPLIFGKLMEDGYRTAYFENMVEIATFSYGFNGLPFQPTDHYLFSFIRDILKVETCPLCVGETPQFEVLLDLTDQLIQLKGKKFIFSFIVDISHDTPAFVHNADEQLIVFLKALLSRDHQKDTLIMIMGDHGQRFGEVHQTFQGSLEERLPFMAIRLPEVLRRRLPGAQSALKMNAEVLTTPHDIHTTLLDAADLPQHMVHYKVKGATLLRGLSLLKPIPMNRSCSEAGITPFWCSCVEWEELKTTDPMYQRTGEAVLNFVNSQFSFLRNGSITNKCATRTLKSINWVKKGRVRRNDSSAGLGIQIQNERFFAKITVGPGSGVFESVVRYISETNQLIVNPKGISRTSKYGNEPDCISSKYPHLNIYCYCI